MDGHTDAPIVATYIPMLHSRLVSGLILQQTLLQHTCSRVRREENFFPAGAVPVSRPLPMRS